MGTMSIQRLLRVLWPPVLLAVLLVAAWQLAADYGFKNAQVLPSPGQVVSAGWQQRSAIWANAVPTLRETELGFALSFVLSWLIAGAMDFSAVTRRAVYPWLVASQSLPVIVIAPAFVLIFGVIALTPKILLVALATFFPLTAALAEGFAGTDPEASGCCARWARAGGRSSGRCGCPARCPSSSPACGSR